MISKNRTMWQVQVKSHTHYFGTFLIQKNSRRTYINYYCTLLLFIGILKKGALPQLHKNYETFYRPNSRWPATSPSILKKAGLRYSATKIHLGQLHSLTPLPYMSRTDQLIQFVLPNGISTL